VPASATGGDAISVQPSGDTSNRNAGVAQLLNHFERGLLGRVRLDVHAIGRQFETERHDADSLRTGLFDGQRRSGPSSNQGSLVLGKRVHDVPHKQGLWTVAVARAVCRENLSASFLGLTIDHSRDHDVTRQTVSLSDQQDGRSMGSERIEGGE
jgi:hypothetical protein